MKFPRDTTVKSWTLVMERVQSCLGSKVGLRPTTRSMNPNGRPPRVVDAFPFEERGYAPVGFARANTNAFTPNQEQDDIESSSSDDRDDFWAELVDLMARKGKGKGKNNINQVGYHDVGVQTDLDANQIFCEIDNALLHFAAVTTEAQAAAAPLQALPSRSAPLVVNHQRALEADKHLQDLRMRVEHMPQSTTAPSVLRQWTVEPPTSARSSRPSRPPLGAPSPHRERSRSREVYRNTRATIASRRHEMGKVFFRRRRNVILRGRMGEEW